MTMTFWPILYRLELISRGYYTLVVATWKLVHAIASAHRRTCPIRSWRSRRSREGEDTGQRIISCALLSKRVFDLHCMQLDFRLGIQ